VQGGDTDASREIDRPAPVAKPAKKK